MGVDATLEAHPQLAKGCEPSMGTLDDPAMPAQAVIAVDAPARDPILEATHPEMAAASLPSAYLHRSDLLL